MGFEQGACHHVFAYGSLMWRPGFDFVRSEHATLERFHRSLCVYSNHYRGTAEHPGLVFGLEIGGSCQGVVYEIDPTDWKATHAYVSKRELVSHVYHEVILPVQALAPARQIQALTYVVDPTHNQYAAPKSLKETIANVKQGHGLSGSCEDYVLNTIQHLRSLDIKDHGIEILEPYLTHSGRVT